MRCARRRDPWANARRPQLRPGMPEEQSIDLDPLAPFRLDLTAWALRRRSHNAVDRWGAAGYQRVMTVEDRPVAVSVNQDGGLDSPRLSVQLAGRPIDQHDEALVFGALRKLLGLTVDLTEFWGDGRAGCATRSARRASSPSEAAAVSHRLRGAGQTPSPASSSRSRSESTCSTASPRPTAARWSKAHRDRVRFRPRSSSQP
jgi:hypothetical protein